VNEAADIRLVLERRDNRAFGRLYDAHTPYLYRFALRLSGGDDLVAQDLVHDTWVRAVENLARFEGRSAFRTWLGGILANRSRQSWREGAREIELDGEEPAPGADAADALLHRTDLDRAIATLPEGCRHVFVLHDIEGHTHESIAALLEIEPGTSKSQLSRARALLRRQLGEPNGARP